MHTFTNDTCATFPNTTELEVANVDLHVIRSDALKLCTELISLSFYDNQLTQISSETFSNLAKLETVDLSQNQILTLEPNSFDNLDGLHALGLVSNNLTRFPVETLGKMANLQRINLSYNDLVEVNVDQILKSFPHLSKFYFCKNMNWSEEEYTQMKEEFERNNVSVECIFFH